MRFKKITTVVMALIIAFQIMPQTSVFAEDTRPLLWYDFADGANSVLYCGGEAVAEERHEGAGYDGNRGEIR